MRSNLDTHSAEAYVRRFCVAILTLMLAMAGGIGFADWDSAKGHGLIPYWENGDDWYTLLIFVNGSEETGDIVSIRIFDILGNSECSMFSIRQREQLIFSTTPSVPTWMPTTASYGYVKFRVDEGGFIHAY
ncbi:MAG: hypothetical protein JW941_11780 [Candidatus Coatesbacteria bacterium]|nr:hypothetical protein [Candidatus Coatesbacteria bacterium]